MRIAILGLTALVLLATPSRAQLAGGTYTVGTGGDYPSLTTAVGALSGGVSGSVTFQLLDETFTDRVVLTQIAGASTTNRVTFRPGGLATPVLTPAEATGDADNYIIRIDGADYVTIEGLSFVPAGSDYERSIWLNGDLEDVVIQNNQFTGSGANTSAEARSAIGTHTLSNGGDTVTGDGLTISGNTITGHGQGIHVEGYNVLGRTPSRPTNVSITGNVISVSDYGIDARELDAPIVSQNEVVTLRTGFSINANSVQGATRIERNRVFGRTFGVSIANSDGPSGSEARLANNMIFTDLSAGQGVRLNSSNGWQVWHNSVLVDGSAGGAALAVSDPLSESLERLDIRNNWLAVANDLGYPYRISATSLTDFVSGTNALSGTIYVGTIGATEYRELGAFLTALDALDASGTEGTGTVLTGVYARDLDTGDLHTRGGGLDGAGEDLGLAVDIDGESRPRPMGTNPDIGADEVDLEVACATTGPGSWTPTNEALWTCGIVPGTTTNATILHDITVPAGPAATAGDLEVDAAGSLTLATDAIAEVWDRFTQTGALDVSVGDLILKADLDGPAVLDAGVTAAYTHEWYVERRAGWRQIGSPVAANFSGLNDDVHTQGAPWADFTFGPATLFEWNAVTQEFVAAGASADGPFEAGKGYFFYVYEDDPDGLPLLPGAVDLEGVEQGPVTISWPNTGTETLNQIANPFGGVLSWDAVYANGTRANIGANVWAYDPGRPGYRTYNAASRVGDGMTGALAPFQGVWVQAMGTGGTASFEIQSGDRDSTLAPTVYSRRAVSPTLALRLEGEGLRASDAIAVFDDRAIKGRDVLDAQWLRPIDAEWVGLFFIEGDRRLVFDARQEPVGAFDLEVETPVAGRYVMSWPDLSALEDGVPAILVDHEAGTRTDLRVSGSYAFEVVETAAASHLAAPARSARSDDARFSLVFGSGATDGEDNPEIPFALLAPFPNPASQVSTIAFDVLEAGPVTLEVVDLLGRHMSTVADGVYEAGRHRVALKVESLSAGVYVVRMRAGAFSAARRLSVLR